MKRFALTFGIALAMFPFSAADAQVVIGPDPGGSPVVSSYMATGGDYVAPHAGQALMPYSYYAAYPQPARTYVGLGVGADFPFQGRAYGSPNDPWSWYYMGDPSHGLARYFKPPL